MNTDLDPKEDAAIPRMIGMCIMMFVLFYLAVAAIMYNRDSTSPLMRLMMTDAKYVSIPKMVLVLYHHIVR